MFSWKETIIIKEGEFSFLELSFLSVGNEGKICARTRVITTLCKEMVAILGALIAELRATPIVTFGHISVLKRYITAKYPDLPVAQSTAILADAVTKIIEKKIAAISEAYRPLIKTNLFGIIAQRRFFQINAGDILEAALPLHATEEHFHTELCQWLNQTLRKTVAFEKLNGMLVKLAGMYQQKAGRDLETLAGKIDRDELAPQRTIVPVRIRANKVVIPKASLPLEKVKTPNIKTPLSKEKASALAVWESTMLESSQFGEPLPQPAETDRQLAGRSQKSQEGPPQLTKVSLLDSFRNDQALEKEGIVPRAARRIQKVNKLNLRRGLLVGAAAAMIIAAMIMIGFVRACLQNNTVLATGTTVVDRINRRVISNVTSTETVAWDESVNQGDYRAFQNTISMGSANQADNQTQRDQNEVNTPPSGTASQEKNATPIVVKADNGVAENPGAMPNGPDQDTFSNSLASEDEFLMKATAYDLSIGSCGKAPQDPLYGITRSGVRAHFGRTIAVDPRVIPLGSKVFLTFPEYFNYLNGVYVAEDTGSAIKGNRIDLFMGEDQPGEKLVYDNAMKFGVQNVKLQVLR